MRPYLRSYVTDGVTGTSVRQNCDGTTFTKPIQPTNPNLRGLHKDAAKRSNGVLATDYSATWITTHSPALAKWESSIDNVVCYDVVGFENVSGNINPIYKSRRSWTLNSQPVTSNQLPVKHITVSSYRNTTGSADPNSEFWKVYDATVNEHLNKIKDQKAMSLVSLAESRQTVSLVRSLSKDVGSALLFVARGIINPKSMIDTYIKYAKKNGLRRPTSQKGLNSRERKFIRNMQGYYKKHPTQHQNAISSVADTASQRWLQYRYGIGPLIADMSAAHDYVYTKWHKFIHSNHIVTKFKFRREGKIHANDLAGGVAFEGTFNALCQHISRYFISNQVARHTQKVGFSPTELLNTLWELVPLSFIVDWAYNLGDYFSALSATVGLTHIQSSFSIKEECVSVTKVNMYAPYLAKTDPHGPDGKLEYGAFVRRTMANFPFPVSPSIRFPFDSLIDKRLFDSLALITQSLINKPKLNHRGA